MPRVVPKLGTAPHAAPGALGLNPASSPEHLWRHKIHCSLSHLSQGSRQISVKRCVYKSLFPQ